MSFEFEMPTLKTYFRTCLAVIIVMTLSFGTGFVQAQDRDYQFTVTQSVSDNPVRMPASKVLCQGHEKKITLTLDDGMTTTLKSSFLLELSEALSLSVKASAGVASAEMKTELFAKMAQENTFTRNKKINRVVTADITIKPLMCFNQVAIIIYEKTLLEVRTEKKKFFGGWKLLNPFNVAGHTDFQPLIEATYSADNCDQSCSAFDQSDKVIGQGKRQAWIKIPEGNRRVFLIPLYWDSRRRIVDPYLFLPIEIRKRLRTD